LEYGNLDFKMYNGNDRPTPGVYDGNARTPPHPSVDSSAVSLAMFA